MIRRLAYVSRLRSGLSLTQIPRIVSICRANNEVNGISGVLLFTGADFAQLIEGEAKSVADLWARIRADKRHCDIARFLDEQAPSRWFPDWRVGFTLDPGLMARIAQWRELTSGSSSSDQASAGDLRQAFAAIDAL